jgi:type VI secretion system secreted protein Hcp
MTYGIFIKMDDIRGESTDDRHRGEIDAFSWGWGVTTPSSTTVGGAGGTAGKASPSDFKFSHRIDFASPSLIKACASGRHFKEAVVTVRKVGEETQELLVIKLSDVIVKSVEAGVETLENSTTENVALAFSKMEYVYNEQRPDRTLGGSNRVLWDLMSNKVA